MKPRDFYMPVLIVALAFGVLRFGAEVRDRDMAMTELAKGSEATLEATLASEPRRPRERAAVERAAFRMPFQAPGLMVPVAGVSREHLSDTWGATRAEGRTHQGIDIMAPQGAIVRAAADGRIVRFFDSVRGGVTIYQFDPAERYVFYYAHLERRAPGLAEGDEVRQGQVIGFVGATGNATTPHLHFEIQRLNGERRWWRAASVNPYPYLLAGEAPR